MYHKEIGRLSDLHHHPNLEGINAGDLIKKTPAQLDQMVKEGKITAKALKQIKKAFEKRDLGKRGKKVKKEKSK